MPGATPLYGFPYPEPSDLVANYPALGQQLAEDVETKINTLTGLSAITGADPSAVSTVSINGCFSAAYPNYFFIMSFQASESTVVRARLRDGTTDDTGANYDRQLLQAAATTVTAARSTGQTTWDVGVSTSGRRGVITLTVASPFLTANTAFTSYSEDGIDGARLGLRSGTNSVSTVFDGITFLTSVGTISGSIRVFGYN